MCQCQDRIAALQASVATLYKELEHRAGIISDQQTTIGELQTENARLRRIEEKIGDYAGHLKTRSVMAI